MGMMDKLLRLMAEQKASDLYLSANAPVLIKIDGVCRPLEPELLSVETPYRLLSEIVTPEQLREFDLHGELNTAIPLQNVGRYRISAMRQRSSCAVVVRFISIDIPPLDQLGLPALLSELVLAKRGLMLVVGATGSGKSTTLAALLDHRNQHAVGHILTIEDPVEYLFKNKQSIVNQREVGTDTQSLNVALKNALRQAPDVILIGEIRDRETMSAAIAYSQSGHLVLATLHANNSYQALNRILNFYPVEVRPTMLNDLASSLRVIVSQRLLRAVDCSRVPALEVMVNTRLISELIENGDFFAVREALENSLAEASQTFEVDLARLIQSGRISRSEGLAYADSPANLMWRLDNSTGPQDDKKAAAEPAGPPAGRPFSDFTIDVKP
ncbi:MAG: PilT/PilU family type 4a pilus ATPase [Burkholderiales bacterium]|nr:PilT/PilU family type 4a pilus ATPase [Burkholderiales bacterium]